MLRLFGTRRVAAPARARLIRPWLEKLETRFCPSNGGTTGLTINYTVTTQNQMQFTGQYSSPTGVSGMTVVITSQGWSGQATTDSHGNYSVTIPVTKLGSATATVTTQNSTVTATTNVTVPPPQITNFTAIQEGNLWEFKGTVTGTPDPQGLIISFSGFPAINGKSTTVLSNGTFDVAFNLGNATGFVTAATTDWWGQASNQPEVFI
jgi:hypothetical protein